MPYFLATDFQPLGDSRTRQSKELELEPEDLDCDAGRVGELCEGFTVVSVSRRAEFRLDELKSLCPESALQGDVEEGRRTCVRDGAGETKAAIFPLLMGVQSQISG